LFAVAASLIAIPFYVLQPTVLWAPLAWSGVFAAINLFQSWLLILERRPVKLTPEEEEIRRLAFQDLPLRKVLRVLSLGSWVTVPVGERVIEQEKLPDCISLIVRGRVRITKDERVLGELVAGDLIGSALILNGIPANVNGLTVEPVRAMSWRIETLKKYLSSDPDTRTVLQRHLARDLATKIGRMVMDSKRSDNIT
jgi:CRP-like cAMP-binding protein